VTNDGPSEATGLRVVDTLPIGLEYVSAEGSSADWACAAAPPDESGTEVSCALAGGVVDGGTAPALVIVATVTAAAYPSVQNVATVSSTTPDPDASGNSWADELEVDAIVDLTVAKQHVGDLRKGEAGSYLITVSNAGPTEDPGGYRVADRLPEGVRYTGFAGDGAACEAEGQLVTCVFDGRLPVGGTAALTLKVDVLSTAPDIVVNEVVVSSQSEDLSADHTATDRATVLPALAMTGGGSVGLAVLAALLLLVAGTALMLLRSRQPRVHRRSWRRRDAPRH
jgi:uncharacterized repeat protein (TIGR01451 family)